jgi:hypothetical protein
MVSMKTLKFLVALVLLVVLNAAPAYPQAETLPVGHPVYAFLKRMEVKGLIGRYRDAVLPLSRRDVASFLVESSRGAGELSAAEQERLRDYLSEFQYDIRRSVAGFSTTLGHGGDLGDSVSAEFFKDRERFLFLEADTSLTLFMNLLLDADARAISGDALESANASYVQLGIRARGTVLDHLGYSLTATNAQFWGSRELLARDTRIAQSHALTVSNIQNFDFEEGSVRYDAGIVSLQIGRERVLWGTGYDQKMIFSENPRVFDFIRGDFTYKAFRYTFMHAWLLGRSDVYSFTLAGDSTVHGEPVNADKFVAAHRLEFSFPGVLDIGAQEMVVYSNRSVDLGYLTPLSLFESVQRSRGERDNVYWGLDLQTHLINGIELAGTILYDDLNVPDMFTSKWNDRYAWQVGALVADPLKVPNTNLSVEYTRVEPYVFSHGRSREDSYTSLGAILGTTVGPNGDQLALGAEWLPLRNLALSLRVIIGRHGINPTDSTGKVMQNVGGDVFFPFREGVDSDRKEFLAGTRVNTRRVEVAGTWEPVNQCWVEAQYKFDALRNTTTGAEAKNHQVAVHVRVEL